MPKFFLNSNNLEFFRFLIFLFRSINMLVVYLVVAHVFDVSLIFKIIFLYFFKLFKLFL